MTTPHRLSLLALLLACLSLSACSDEPAVTDSEAGGGTEATGAESGSRTGRRPSATGGAADGARHPDIVDVEVTGSGDGTYDFAVTVSSPYDSPERYADGWRVRSPDGEVYGVHELAHDHAAEQPFTRRQTRVAIPDGVERVVVEGRDSENGFGGETATVALP